MFTIGALVILGGIALVSIIGAVKGGVLLESIGEVLGSVLFVVLEYLLIFGLILYGLYRLFF